MEKAKAKKVNITLPVDFVTGDNFDAKATVGAATVKEGIKGELMVSSNSCTLTETIDVILGNWIMLYYDMSYPPLSLPKTLGIFSQESSTNPSWPDTPHFNFSDTFLNLLACVSDLYLFFLSSTL